MDYRQLTNVLTRFSGVLIIVFAIVNIPVYFLQYYGLQIDSIMLFIGITATPFIITIMVGMILFLFPSIVTNRMVSNDNNSDNIFKKKELETVGLSIIGAYLLITSIVDLIYLITLLNQGQGVSVEYITPDRWADIIASIAELTFGLLLFFRSTMLVNFAGKFR